MTVQFLNVSGASPSTIHLIDISGSGTEGTTRTVHVLDVTGSGSVQPSLSASKATYEPGELVTVAAINRGTSDSFTVTGGFPADGAVDGGVLTFLAPATVDKATYTVGYNGLAFITINVNQAFALSTSGKPALVQANIP